MFKPLITFIAVVSMVVLSGCVTSYEQLERNEAMHDRLDYEMKKCHMISHHHCRHSIEH